MADIGLSKIDGDGKGPSAQGCRGAGCKLLNDNLGFEYPGPYCRTPETDLRGEDVASPSEPSALYQGIEDCAAALGDSAGETSVLKGVLGGSCGRLADPDAEVSMDPSSFCLALPLPLTGDRFGDGSSDSASVSARALALLRRRQLR